MLNDHELVNRNVVKDSDFTVGPLHSQLTDDIICRQAEVQLWSVVRHVIVLETHFPILVKCIAGRVNLRAISMLIATNTLQPDVQEVVLCIQYSSEVVFVVRRETIVVHYNYIDIAITIEVIADNPATFTCVIDMP